MYIASAPELIILWFYYRGKNPGLFKTTKPEAQVRLEAVTGLPT